MGLSKIAFRLPATTLIIATLACGPAALAGAVVVAIKQLAGLASLDQTALRMPRALSSSASHFRYGRLPPLAAPLAPGRLTLGSTHGSTAG
jgi:hypothetical protein